MKAVILEKRLFSSAALTEDGDVIKVYKKANVGETIEIAEKTNNYSVLRLATAFSLVLLLSAGIIGYNTVTLKAYSYVSIDVNPSIELTLNRLNKVIDVSALDEEAETIVNQMLENNIKGSNYEEALKITENSLKDNGYLKDEDYLLINIASDNDDNKEKLEDITKATFNEKDEKHLIVSHSDIKERDEAREKGISTGIYHEIVEKVQGESSDKLEPEMIEEYRDLKISDFFEENPIPEEPQKQETEDFKPEEPDKQMTEDHLQNEPQEFDMNDQRHEGAPPEKPDGPPGNPPEKPFEDNENQFEGPTEETHS